MIPKPFIAEWRDREHFNVSGLKAVPYEVTNGWFTGSTNITTYSLSELLGTKLRALYQRKKGRDLFDLYYASRVLTVNFDEVIHCYNEYMKRSAGKPPTGKQFSLNLKKKIMDINFTGDREAIARPGIEYNIDEAFEWLINEMISRM